MNPLIDVEILRVFLGETAQRDGKPLYELLVNEARQRGMAGATVTRGFMGFGANSLLHTAKILRLSEDLPVIVEVVDTPERIADFLRHADELVTEGSIVVEKARAIFHAPFRIRDVMSAEVATVTPETSLSAVVELLLHREVKALPVVEGKNIVGIITGGDLLQRAGMPLRLDVQRVLPPEFFADHLRQLDQGGLKAKDVMSSPAHTLNIKARVPDALEFMAKRKLKRLPVVDDAGRLMGIVSRVDVLRVLGKAASVPSQLPTLPPGIRKTVRDVMFEDVPTAGPDSSLKETLDKLVASPLRRVVIVDERRKVLGLVLDRDLVALYARQNKPGLLQTLVATLSRRPAAPEELHGMAKDVMKTDVFTLRPETALADAVRLLVDKKAKRVVVTDDAGFLLGMVDRDRLLCALGAAC
jgi:CBS-domain-containing membrane protein